MSAWSDTCPFSCLVWCHEYISKKHRSYLKLQLSPSHLDSCSSAPRMHFALTMPQASAVTANQASMEMDASVCLMVRSWPFFLSAVPIGCLYILKLLCCVRSVLLIQVPPSVLAVRWAALCMWGRLQYRWTTLISMPTLWWETGGRILPSARYNLKNSPINRVQASSML